MTDWQDTTSMYKGLMRPGISREESQQFYKQMAQNADYDKIHNTKVYSGCKQLKKVTENLWQKDALILDVGAGTGLSGQALKENGYDNLHALDPQSDFNNSAKQKGMYKETIQEFIGAEEPLKVADNTYDGLISVGSFAQGHIPISAVPEMIRIVKSGGYIVICMRHEYFWTVPEYADRLEPLMKQLEQEGKWNLVQKVIYPNHFCHYNGIMMKYQVC